MTDIKRPLAIGTYKPTTWFSQIDKHMAVGFDRGTDDIELVACVGTYEHGNLDESLAYAYLFMAAPDMLAALETCREAIRNNGRPLTDAEIDAFEQAVRVISMAKRGLQYTQGTTS